MSLWKSRLIGILRGHWPRWWAELKLKTRLRPWTFRGMVIRQIATVREPYILRMVDKLEARNLCQERSNTVLIPKLFQSAQNSNELNPELWPKEFVIKPTHGSGALVIVTKEPRVGLRYDIDVDSFQWHHGTWGMLATKIDISTLKSLGEYWLQSNYEYWRPKTPEWAYGQLTPKIIVEELIVNLDGSPVIELRFHCINGRVQIGRITETLSSNKSNWTLDRSGVVLNATIGRSKEGEAKCAPIPANWDVAVVEAEKLSKDYPYVRVDLFATARGIFFSEFTPYPFGGNHDFRPRSLSRRLAKMWRTGQDLPLPNKVYSN